MLFRSKHNFDQHFFTHTTFGTRLIALELAGLSPPKMPSRKMPKRKRTRKQGRDRTAELVPYASSPRIEPSPLAPPKPSRSAPSASARLGLVQCPKCPSPVRSDHLQRHLRKAHGVGAAASVKPGAAQAVSLAQRPVRKLTKKVAAGGTSRYRAMATGTGQSGPVQDDADERLSSIDNHWEERRLDGSRDYWQIREEGRFGSHPSYDDCDDESAP